jgi:ankyrin repeat protein
MRTIKIFFVLILSGMGRIAFAQEMPAEIKAALKADDSVKFATLVSKDSLNNCYKEGNWQYSLLSQAIRSRAGKCFNLLIARGADVNKACGGYVPPLMHAVKYGPLAMVKALVAKGADINYQYDGEYEPAEGQTPLTYAEKNNQPEIAAYLRGLKGKQ